MEQLCEDLIKTWLNMSVVLRNNRLISTMTFNEIFVCNLLYNKSLKAGELLTATDICEKTRLLKSQMNKVLNSLEKRGLIEKVRSNEDKRKIYIQLNEDNLNIYLEEHQRVLKMVEELIQTIGVEKTHQAISIIGEITNVMGEITSDK